MVRKALRTRFEVIYRLVLFLQDLLETNTKAFYLTRAQFLNTQWKQTKNHLAFLFHFSFSW